MNKNQDILYQYMKSAYEEENLGISDIIWSLQDAVEHGTYRGNELFDKRWNTKYFHAIINAYSELNDDEINKVLYVLLRDELPQLKSLK